MPVRLRRAPTPNHDVPATAVTCGANPHARDATPARRRTLDPTAPCSYAAIEGEVRLRSGARLASCGGAGFTPIACPAPWLASGVAT
jgi:hypothetical protein